MLRRVFLMVGAATLVAGCVSGSRNLALAPGSTLIVVRHSDRDGENLSDLGHRRSRALVRALEGFDIAAIHAPGIQRNLDTAAPLSEARQLPVERIPQEAPTGPLVARGAGRTVIWIGNKGNIRTIWDDLNLPEPAPLDYGDLHIIRADADGRVSVERRRFEP